MNIDYVMYDSLPLGVEVRKQIAHEFTFRVRRGNGCFGSIDGKKYQDKMTYYVPSSINNVQGQSARNALSSAVYNWKTTLTPAQKEAYNKRAAEKRFLSGYNLYVGEYVRANA